MVAVFVMPSRVDVLSSVSCNLVGDCQCIKIAAKLPVSLAHAVHLKLSNIEAGLGWWFDFQRWRHLPVIFLSKTNR